MKRQQPTPKRKSEPQSTPAADPLPYPSLAYAAQMTIAALESLFSEMVVVPPEHQSALWAQVLFLRELLKDRLEEVITTVIDGTPTEEFATRARREIFSEGAAFWNRQQEQLQRADRSAKKGGAK